MLNPLRSRGASGSGPSVCFSLFRAATAELILVVWLMTLVGDNTVCPCEHVSAPVLTPHALEETSNRRIFHFYSAEGPLMIKR